MPVLRLDVSAARAEDPGLAPAELPVTVIHRGDGNHQPARSGPRDDLPALPNHCR